MWSSKPTTPTLTRSSQAFCIAFLDCHDDSHSLHLVKKIHKEHSFLFVTKEAERTLPEQVDVSPLVRARRLEEEGGIL